jgi:hypothetical protein
MANHADIPNGITLKNPHKSSPFRRKKRSWVEKKKIHYHSLTAVAIAAAGKFFNDSKFQIPDSGLNTIGYLESGMLVNIPVSSMDRG